MKREIILLLTLILIVMLTCGCFPHEEIEEEETAQPVETMEIQREVQALELDYIGVLDSQEMKKYSFEVPGKIENIFVKEGDTINPGQTLAVLDQEDLKRAVENARIAKENAAKSYENAKDYFNRMQHLYENEAIPRQEYENAELKYETEKTRFNQAQLEYDSAVDKLEDSEIISDMEGFVVDILFEESEVVEAGHPVIAARDAVQMATTGVSQSDIKYLQEGTKARVEIDDYEAEGAVWNIAQSMDEESRTFEVKVELIENLPEKIFRVGSTAKIYFIVEEQEGIWIPFDAVLKEKEQDYVYIVENDKAVRKDITIKSVKNDYILVEGLAPGDKIVTKGMSYLQDKQEVTVK